MSLRKPTPEPLLGRQELAATLFSIADIREELRRIRLLLEGALGEEDSENDA